MDTKECVRLNIFFCNISQRDWTQVISQSVSILHKSTAGRYVYAICYALCLFKANRYTFREATVYTFKEETLSKRILLHSEKGVYSGRKRFVHCGSRSFPYRVNRFSERVCVQ